MWRPLGDDAVGISPRSLVIKKLDIDSLRSHARHLRNDMIGRLDRTSNYDGTRMWANAQPDGRPAEHRWRRLFNAAKFS